MHESARQAARRCGARIGNDLRSNAPPERAYRTQTVRRSPSEGETDHVVFDGVAGEYARTRPGYPDAALDWVAGRAELGPGSDVVDLAAGTGKLTVSLVARAYRVVAVEPLPGMRAQLERALPDVEALDGTAEQIPLADGSFDAVLVGQAFHWFEPYAALDEIARVLRPGGRLVLLWNLWDLDDPLQVALDEIIAPLATGRIRNLTTSSHPYGEWSAAIASDGRFHGAEQARFAHRVTLDADATGERIASSSQVQSAPAAAAAAAIEAARALVAGLPGGRGTFHYQTEIDIARRR
jgi:ubiquinone/menaquinone biosynthesis C-methylase UbiE